MLPNLHPQDLCKIALSGKSLPEIEAFTANIGLPSYRARQVHSWIYAKRVQSFNQITELSQAIRQCLAEKADIALLKMAQLKVSHDGTRKYLFELPDKKLVESVLMSFSDRTSLTACVSSQVGCAVGCTFCATGSLGFTRNLSCQEIVDQVMSIERESGKRVANVVYMGQGEPLLNVEEVIKSVHVLINSVGIGQRHITISTSGIIPGIKRLAEENLQITLALSLHAPDSATRETIVPITSKYKLPELMETLSEYQRITKRRVTIEYVLLEGVTDTQEQAIALAQLVEGLNCNINLIPYNSTANGNGTIIYKRPSRKAQDRFKQLAERSGKTVTIRLERGSDIEAACGQLHNAFQANLKR